jgi:uncharacterized protein (TIGR02001 family)
MKKIIVSTLAAGLIAGTAFAEVSTTFDFASAYVFRGVTLNNGAVFQPGIEASGFGMPEEYGGFAFGAWANYDIGDYDGNVPGSTVTETDWYVSYSLPVFVEGLDLFVGYTEYMYGGAGRDEEVNLGAGYEISGVGLGLTVYKGVGGLIGDQLYVEATAAYSYDFTEELSSSVFGSIGFMQYDEAIANSFAPSLEDGFHNYTIGADIAYALSEKWSVGAALTYIGQGDDTVLPEGTFGYDVDVVGMLSLACDM